MMEALLGIVITLQVATIGWLLYHSSQCAAFHERVASLEADAKATKNEIGTHDTGIRGSHHKLRNELAPIVLWVQQKMDKE